MMKDQLEEFIKKNKSQFDDKEPSARVWLGVKKAITPSASVWNSVMVWRAAAVIFMALSLYLLIPKNDNVHLANANAEENVLTDFQDVEKFYVTEISNKVSMINGFDVDNEGLNGYTQNFQQLEAMYMVLKEEMKTSPSVKVKEALVLNLLIQIDLLNKQLEKLDNAEEKDKVDGKIS